MIEEEDQLLPKILLEDEIHDPDDLIPSQEDRRSIRSCQEIGCPMDSLPREMGRMEVNVIPASLHRTNSYQCSKMPFYDMCHRPRGLALIIDIEACRGDRPDQGVDECAPTAGRQGQAKKRRSDAVDAVVCNRPDDVCRARPTWEDMIIAYSTIPGYASLRDHEKGTWFVQSLVEVFMAHAHDTELIDLLRMTSERLSHFTNEQGEKQTCNVEMRHLYKRIYFNPGHKLSFNPSTIARSVSNPPYSSDLSKSEQWGQGFKRRKTWKAVRSLSMPHSGNIGKYARLHRESDLNCGLQQTNQVGEIRQNQNMIQFVEDIEEGDEACLLFKNNELARPKRSRAKAQFLKLINNIKNSKYGVNLRRKRGKYTI